MFFFVFIVSCVPFAAHAATITWGGGGVTNNWTECANWVGGICPGSSDSVVFNNTSTKNSTINSTATSTVGSITISSGYTGIITQQISTMTVSNTFSQAAGTYNQGTSTLVLSSASSFTLSSGTYNVGVATTTFQGSATFSGGTYNASSTSVANFNSAAINGISSLTCTGTFPGIVNLGILAIGTPTFTLSSGCTITTASTTDTTASTTINGTINFGSSITLGGLNITSTGTVTTGTTTITLNNNGGTYPSNFNEASGATFNASGVTLNFNSSGFNTSNNFVCNGTFPGLVNLAISGFGTPTFTLASGCTITTASTTNSTASTTINGTINFGPTVTLASLGIGSTGTVTTTGTTIALNDAGNPYPSNFIESVGATFNASGVTLNFNSSGFNTSSNFVCNGTFPGLVNLAISGAGTNTFTLASGCIVTTAATTTTTAAITVNGTLNLSGYGLSTTHSLTIGSTGTLGLEGNEPSITAPTLNASSTVQYYGSGSYSSLKAGSTYQNISFTGSGSWATSTNLTINGNFNQTNGTFTHTGTLTFAGTTAPSVATTSAGTVLDNVIVNTVGQTLSLAGSGLSLSGNLTLTSGTLDASTAGCSSTSCNITLAGNWIGGNNLFTPRTGIVTLDGTGQQIMGTSTFYALTKTTSSTDTLTFGANQTQTVTHTWTAQGAASNLLSLRSSSTGIQWEINPEGTVTVSYLNVEDSDNTNSSPITTSGLNITNNGDNTNWTFTIAPTVTTSAATSVATSTVTINGAITVTGGANATQSGFAYGTDSALASPIATSTLGSQTGTASFSQNLVGLTPNNTTYYFRAYATNTSGTSYGSILSFTETALGPPVVSVQAATSITQTGGTLNGTLISDGGSTVTSEGFNYGLTTSYGSTASSTGAFEASTFSQVISGLACNTTYDYEAVASNVAGTSTATGGTFTTVACVSALTTNAATSVATSTVTINGAITVTGGANATQSGFAYGTGSTLSSPLATSTLGSQTGTASFAQNLTGLSPGTTYYFRAYATNAGGTGYGSIVSLTMNSLSTPTVTVQSASSITQTGATLNGTLTANGGSTVTVEGFNYGLTSSYGLTASSTGSFSIGAFTQNITGLTCNTAYHYEAVATNVAGTSTSGDQTFTTSACTPSVSTSVPTGGGLIVDSSALAPSSVSFNYSKPRAQIISPEGQIVYLDTSNTSSTIASTPASTANTITQQLYLGMNDIQVFRLQQFLNSKGFLVALKGPGSPGHETMFYGAATRIAVIRFQKAHGITPTGGVGPLTRKAIVASSQ